MLTQACIDQAVQIIYFKYAQIFQTLIAESANVKSKERKTKLERLAKIINKFLFSTYLHI
jgi:hypothetical protein